MAVLDYLRKFIGAIFYCMLFFFKANAKDEVIMTQDLTQHEVSTSFKESSSKTQEELSLIKSDRFDSHAEKFVPYFQDIPSVHNTCNTIDEIHKVDGKYTEEHFYLPNEKLSGLFSPVLKDKKGALLCTGTYRCLFDAMLGDFDNVIL
jgi:hypothetical protein